MYAETSWICHVQETFGESGLGLMYRVCEASLAFEGSVQGSDILLSSFWFQKGTSVVLC